MPAPVTLTLTDAERLTLHEARAHHPKPYVRERAAGLLKVAAGASARQVARHGLLKPRHERTVRRWVHDFQRDGYGSLRVRAGRGRKPAFSPTARGAAAGPRRVAGARAPRPGQP